MSTELGGVSFFRDLNNVGLFLSIVCVFLKLFAGLLISLDSLPVWVAWMRHFSFMKYGIEVCIRVYYYYICIIMNATQAFSINEMNGLRFQGPW